MTPFLVKEAAGAYDDLCFNESKQYATEKQKVGILTTSYSLAVSDSI